MQRIHYCHLIISKLMHLKRKKNYLFEPVAHHLVSLFYTHTQERILKNLIFFSLKITRIDNVNTANSLILGHRKSSWGNGFT